MKPALIYSLKVWLTSVILSPLFATIYSLIHGFKAPNETAILIVLVIFYGLVCSIPCFLSMLLVIWILNKYALVMKPIYQKIILSVLSVPAIFLMLKLALPYSYLSFKASCAAATLVCIWIYRLKPLNQEKNNPPSV